MSVSFSSACRKASLVAAFLLFLQVSFSQKKVVPTNTFPALDQAIEERKKLLGKDFSVVVAMADSVVYQKDYGDPANRKTAFAVGDCSQWFTAALIMQLVDEGKVSLDDPVAKYLPPFESYRRNYVTIRHCLTHQTGLGKEGFLANLFERKKSGSLEEEVMDILKKEIHANAGEAFRYTAYGPVIAARVAEVVTKKRFDQIIRTKLFVPLAMRSTSFTTDDGSAPNPAGGAKSTAADLIKFLQMLLNRGKAGDKQILSEAAVEEMRKVQVAASKTGAVPKAVAGFPFALGSWGLSPTSSQGEGVALQSLGLPGLSGTWPVVDFAKGYVLLVFAREFSGEQIKTPYEELKNLADQQMKRGT